MSEHEKSGSSGSDKSFGMLAIPYDDFDIMLTDVNEKVLENLGRDNEVEHLSVGSFKSPPFPVTGIVYGLNMRLMVPLAFQRTNMPTSKIINVWCLVDTGCPYTCLSVKTLEAFFGPENVIDGVLYRFSIQNQKNPIDCQVSRVGTHFEHVNILGMNALRKLKASIHIDWDNDTFELNK